MNNILLNISAAALQRQLEKEANSGSSADHGDLDVIVQEERASLSILSRLTAWLDHAKAAQPQAAAPKLKNKIV